MEILVVNEQPLARVAVLEATDLRWSYDSKPPHWVTAAALPQYGQREDVDPWGPCYTHDVGEVSALLRECVTAAPLGEAPVTVHVSLWEGLSRTNGWSTVDHPYYRDETPPWSGPGLRPWEGLINLNGKRIEIHPAITRYLAVLADRGFDEVPVLVRDEISRRREPPVEAARRLREDAASRAGRSLRRWHASHRRRRDLRERLPYRRPRARARVLAASGHAGLEAQDRAALVGQRARRASRAVRRSGVSDKPASVHAGKVIDDIRAIAREHGYAVGVHGSMRIERDIDLIAAPWTKKAHAPRTLMRAINKLPYLWRVVAHDHDPPKPHGRRGYVWIIQERHGSCPRYVDLSVMPRLQDGPA